MSNVFVFADEAGCFTFRNQKGASKYFIICTIASESWSASEKLLTLRRNLALYGEPDRDKLHATSDLQEVRNEVFNILKNENFRIDSTIIEKSKTNPKLRESEEQFYQKAWHYHFKHVGPKIIKNYDKMLLTAAALGTKRTRAAFKESVNNSIQKILPREKWQMSFHESSKDPLLWVADYCAWAIQRKWERGDTRSYNLISDKIITEFELFEFGNMKYY